MRLRNVIQAAAILGLCLPIGLPAQQTGKDRADLAFQAAIKAEVIDGNLKSAIEQYKKLADGSDHAVAAKALIRLGSCYEKLGDVQARKAYDRVVRDFADQADMVAEARTRLAALLPPAKAPALAVRRIWAGPEVSSEGSPSPDGKYLVFTDRAAGFIALRDLVSGETRPLLKNLEGGGSWGSRSLFSPDGKTVVLTHIAAGGVPEVQLAGLDSARPRVIFRDEHFSDIEIGAWSPDGAFLAVGLTAKDEAGGDGNYQVAVISVRDGAAKILKSLGPRRPQLRGFSPDSRSVAADYPSEEDPKNRDIYLLAIDGSRETPLVQHPADDRLLGWVPDGKGILFSSDRSIRWGIWFLRITEGKPAGLPEKIRFESGPIEPLGFARSGAFFYEIENGGREACLAELDSTAVRFSSVPAPIRADFAGPSEFPSFSPDGGYLAYFLNKTGNQWLLCVRSVKTGEEREFPVPGDLEILRISRWEADSQGILISGTDRQLQHAGFYRIGIRNGDVRAILSSNPEADKLSGEWTPDGKTIFLVRDGLAYDDKAARILRRDPATGNEREIYRAALGENIANLALSPDGLEVAFSVGSAKGFRPFDRLGVVPAQGGDSREILRLNGRESIRSEGLVWTPDGRRLLFVKAIEASRQASTLELWRVSSTGQELQKVGLLASDSAFGAGVSGLRLNPDGKGIVFQAGRHKPEVWVMENYDPASKTPEALGGRLEATMEAWIHIAALGPGSQTILAKGDYNYEGTVYSLSLTPDGKIQGGVRHAHTFFGEGGDWSLDGILSDFPLRPNDWYHVVCTIYSAKSISLYVNGALVKTGPITQSIPRRPAEEPLHVGLLSYYGKPIQAFKGRIEGVAVYDRVLSVDEIRQRYSAGMRRK